MFQIGSLIVFCGLLALPLPVDLAPSPTNLGQMTSALRDSLLSGGLLDSIRTLPVLDILRFSGSASKGLIGNMIQQMINPLRNITGIEITTPKLLELGFVPSPDGRRLYLNIPLSWVINMRVPMVPPRRIKLSVKLNTTLEVYPVESENGVHLVVGDCSSPPGRLEIDVVNSPETLPIQLFLKSVINTFTETIPMLVQNQICSTVNGLLRQLDVSLTHNIINTLIPNRDFIINA